MKKIFSTGVILSFILFATTAIAGGEVISAGDFVKLIKANKGVVVIDAGKAADYSKMHVPNAVSIPHKELYKDGSIEGLIKSPEELASYFGKKGVSDQSTIVIYDDGSNKYSSRVYWILKYLGAKDMKILHKDMDAWKKVRLPITGRPTSIKKKTFTVNLKPEVLANVADVKKAVTGGSAIIIDARAKTEYDGTSEKPKSKGHVSKAINIEYKEFVNDKGAFKSAEELKKVAAKYGLTPDKEIMLYCVTGVRAAVIYFALAEILDYPNVKVYDGSYNEWIADPANPMN